MTDLGRLDYTVDNGYIQSTLRKKPAVERKLRNWVETTKDLVSTSLNLFRGKEEGVLRFVVDLNKQS